jgi:hypothetical protein
MLAERCDDLAALVGVELAAEIPQSLVSEAATSISRAT